MHIDAILHVQSKLKCYPYPGCGNVWSARDRILVVNLLSYKPLHVNDVEDMVIDPTSVMDKNGINADGRIHSCHYSHLFCVFEIDCSNTTTSSTIEKMVAADVEPIAKTTSDVESSNTTDQMVVETTANDTSDQMVVTVEPTKEPEQQQQPAPVVTPPVLQPRIEIESLTVDWEFHVEPSDTYPAKRSYTVKRVFTEKAALLSMLREWMNAVCDGTIWRFTKTTFTIKVPNRITSEKLRDVTIEAQSSTTCVLFQTKM